jgi:hypothetical protein
MFIGTRTDLNTHNMYQRGALIGTTAGDNGALPDNEFMVLARNQSPGVSAQELTNGPIGAYSIGAGLTPADVTAYSAHMQTFQTALARNV